LRLWELGDVPPGLTHDEANNVHDAAAVLDGLRPFYFPVAQGKEPLYPYTVAGFMAVLGRDPWVMRLSSAVWGLATVALTYVWTRRAFGTATALLTAAGLATGFWSVSTSRMGLRAVTLPAVFAAFSCLLWLGLWGKTNKSKIRWALLLSAGSLLGLSLYTYLAARAMALVPVVFALYLLLVRKAGARQPWAQVLSVVLIGAAVATPLFIHLQRQPDAEIRVGQLDQPLRALLQGDPDPLLARAADAVQFLSVRGDTFVPYNLPGKPVLDPVMSTLFVVGLAIALWRWRNPAYAWALFWLLLGLLPALVTGREAANLRAIGAQPMVYFLPGLAMAEAGRLVARRFRLRTDGSVPTAWAIWVPVSVGFLVLGGLTFHDYINRWAADPDTRVHYHADVVAIAQYVQSRPPGPIAISALYPGQYHDPRVVEAVTGEPGSHLRWFDGRRALVLPPEGGLLLVPAWTPLAPDLRQLVEPLAAVERIIIHPAHLNRHFDVLSAPAGSGFAREVDATMPRLGGVLAALGADQMPTRLVAGETGRLLTSWAVTGQLAPDQDAVLFAQVLGPDGRVLAQEDRLDVPSWNWHVGDRFWQLFELTLPPDAEPGVYRLIAGAYTVVDRVDAVLAGSRPDHTASRLPVTVGGMPAGDAIELDPIEVVSDG